MSDKNAFHEKPTRLVKGHVGMITENKIQLEGMMEKNQHHKTKGGGRWSVK